MTITCKLIFCSLLLGSYAPAQAQAGDGMLYAAPGMPVILPRRLAPRPAAAAVKPWLTEPLPRFWLDPDSLARQRGYRQALVALMQRLRYPPLALRSQLDGTVQVRVVLAPDGSPVGTRLVRSSFSLELADARPGQALAQEALRVARLLRFAPRPGGAADSVEFPITYLIQ